MIHRRRGRVWSWLLALAPAAFALGAAACPPGAPALFEELSPSATGVAFTNRLTEDTNFNSLNYLYYYNGGGVAVGDINNDGLPDLYFTANTGANRLYLNRGGYRFEDVTASAGVADSVGWKTGVTMADVNGDGFIDIFVCGVSYLGVHGRNVLYINNGNGTFADRTAEYGLDFEGYATQALFFDYDGDGDLDMYLLNHSVHSEHGAGTSASRLVRNPRAGDRLYRNEHGRFADVSAAAGIYGGAFGYGLGVVATDVDGDGCLDLAIANDFQEDDFLYHNNCDGTFTEIGAVAWQHTSRSSMGVDAADFNNDGRPDIVTADMLPDRETVLKTSATVESFALSRRRLEAGYRPQLAHNALQLNRGAITDGGRGGQVRFSEIAFMAGVAATDWSWAPLFADLDNDGRKDLFITSGIYRRPNDLDYLALIGEPGVQASLRGGITRQNLSLVAKMPSAPVPNHVFRNNGDLTFTDATDAWGLARRGFSNGAAYVDLDNSGSLDLVVNRINAPAAIYRNRAREINGAHYLRVELRGDDANTAGVGARVIAWSGGSMQMLEQMPTRGFESSVDPRLHFGLGSATSVDSLLIVWPDRRFQMLANVAVDRTLTLEESDAAHRYSFRPITASAPPVFTDVTAAVGLAWKHREPESLDFLREPLLPHRLSAQGPAVAVADVNGDGLDDLFVGGGRGQPAALFLQRRDGRLRAADQPAFLADSLYDSADAVFFDANGDGRPDLYVVSGTETVPGHPDLLPDRLYLNDGHGRFRRDTIALPPMEGGGSRVVAADFNGDGRIDLFVGRTSISGAYGVPAGSYLLENAGGHFRDVTGELAPALASLGMITGAAWIDYDRDGRLDLVVTGEWLPVSVFRQEHGHFVDHTKEAGFTGTNGWWNDVTVADLNGDGFPDLVLGNLGLNSYLTASPTEPVRLYAGDFAHARSVVPILTSYKNGVSYPVATLDELTAAIPDLRSRFSSYANFAGKGIDAIVDPSARRASRVLEACDFATSVAINTGSGGFVLRRLPVEAQVAPVRASLAEDFDGDGHADLLVAGNVFDVPPVFGRYDASYGLLLHGIGNGQFVAIDPATSGLALAGEVRHIRSLRGAHGRRLVVIARNDDTLRVLRIERFSPVSSFPVPGGP